MLNQLQGSHSESWHQTWDRAVHPPALLAAEASFPRSAPGQGPSRGGHFSALFLYFSVCLRSCLGKGATETSNPKSGVQGLRNSQLHRVLLWTPLLKLRGAARGPVEAGLDLGLQHLLPAAPVFGLKCSDQLSAHVDCTEHIRG